MRMWPGEIMWTKRRNAVGWTGLLIAYLRLSANLRFSVASIVVKRKTKANENRIEYQICPKYIQQQYYFYIRLNGYSKRFFLLFSLFQMTIFFFPLLSICFPVAWWQCQLLLCGCGVRSRRFLDFHWYENILRIMGIRSLSAACRSLHEWVFQIETPQKWDFVQKILILNTYFWYKKLRIQISCDATLAIGRASMGVTKK